MSKICLCALAKLENNYINEWIDYYLSLGFDNIIIYDNNDTNSENIADVCKCYDTSIVEIKNVIGIPAKQNKWYSDCYRNVSKSFDYVAFFDVDEFLFLPNNMTIHDFLERDKFKNFECIRIPWMLYDDSNIINVIDGNYKVLNRFTSCKLVRDSKAIVRTNIEINTFTPHGPLYLKTCDPNGNECNNGSMNINKCLISDKVIDTNVYLKHFMMKTLEEYIKFKMKREEKNSWNKKGRTINDGGLDRFFQFNQKTPEKLEYLKSIGITYK